MAGANTAPDPIAVFQIESGVRHGFGAGKTQKHSDVRHVLPRCMLLPAAQTHTRVKAAHSAECLAILPLAPSTPGGCVMGESCPKKVDWANAVKRAGWFQD